MSEKAEENIIPHNKCPICNEKIYAEASNLSRGGFNRSKFGNHVKYCRKRKMIENAWNNYKFESDTEVMRTITSSRFNESMESLVEEANFNTSTVPVLNMKPQFNVCGMMNEISGIENKKYMNVFNKSFFT